MDFFVFVSDQWLLVSVMLVLIYLLAWRETSKGGKSLSYHEVTRLLNQEEGVVFDIRPEKEYVTGHITGAINIPLANIANRIGEFEIHKDKTLILVDKFGQNTGSVGKQLMAKGLTVVRMKGGMAEWEASKLPVVKPAGKAKKAKKDKTEA